MLAGVATEARSIGRYTRLVLLGGLTVLRFGISGVMLVTGIGLIGIVAFISGVDRFVLALATLFAVALVWIIGGYRVWKQTDRARAVAAEAADKQAAEAAREAAHSEPGTEVPFDVELAAQIKQGRQLIEAMREPFTGRLQSMQVDPWTARVTQLLSTHDPQLARNFIDSDEGVAPWNPMLLSPDTHVRVMETRVRFLEDALAATRR